MSIARSSFGSLFVLPVVLCLWSCVDTPQRPATVSARRAPLAQSYVPGPSPTDRRIAEAQHKLTELPNDPEAYVDLAVLMMRRRRETSMAMMMLYAQDAVKAALAIDPEHTEARLLQGLGRQYDHDFAGARAAGLSVLEKQSDNVTALLLVGDASLELGDYEDALTAYQRALDAEPDLRVYNRAAHISWLFGEPEEALEFLDMAIDAGSVRDPENRAWCFVDLGDVFRHRGDAVRAEAAARRALELMPNYHPALTLLARAQTQAGRAQDAIKTYDLALKRLVTVEGLLAQAELLEASGQTKRMTHRIEQARALVEDDPRPMAHYLARRNEQPKEALRLANIELKARKNIMAWDTLALALIRNERYVEAEAALDRAQALEAPWAEPMLHRALLFAKTHRVSEAASMLEKAQNLDATVDPGLVKAIQRELASKSVAVSP